MIPDIPSVREILVIHSTSIGADILRRDTAGAWPEAPIRVEAGEIALASVDFHFPLTDL